LRISMKLGYVLLLLLIGSCFFLACTPVLSETPAPNPIKASAYYICPLETVTLSYTSETVKGDTINYKWGCTDGSFEGKGSTITWKAPNQYGKFHLIVLVENEFGKGERATIDIDVVGCITITPVQSTVESYGCSTCGR
jgi:hypothetical protein